MNATEHFARAVQQLAAALLTVCRDASDALRAMMQFSEFEADEAAASLSSGGATAAMRCATRALFRRAAVSALARAASAYTPDAYEDALRVQAQVSALLASEITQAADQGEDASFAALRALQAAVKRDLTARGANLARIKTVVMNEALPALTLAQRLYRDAQRADELVRRAHPVHPAFMPLRFQALAQ